MECVCSVHHRLQEAFSTANTKMAEWKNGMLTPSWQQKAVQQAEYHCVAGSRKGCNVAWLLFQQLEVILRLDVGEIKKGSLEAEVFRLAGWIPKQLNDLYFLWYLSNLQEIKNPSRPNFMNDHFIFMYFSSYKYSSWLSICFLLPSNFIK